MSAAPQPDVPPLRRLTVEHDGVQPARIILDDVDVSTALVAYQITAEANPRDPYPHVTLELAPVAARDLRFDGLARVAIGEPAVEAAAFLDAIDAETLEQSALNRTDVGNEPHALTAAMLRQLAEWARGRS